ncbi:hypothetical protein CDCA_CDCA12G3539 [Cyanidium caldarium]|uniref:DNA 3'-5' helicase n=1 Tax=Cyanidium caldarium TaxID=2771 RepID=A0AAV9IZL5_CYACA|nr:hypothetical protein CDCA_CDCA12G3539 [Cyanidium caldarium]
MEHLDDDLEDVAALDGETDDERDVDYRWEGETEREERRPRGQRAGGRRRRARTAGGGGGGGAAAAAGASDSSDEWTTDDAEGEEALRVRVPRDFADIADQERLQLASGWGVDYARALTLKPDHAQRPIWVLPNGRIFLETFSPVYRQASDFLVAISEPVSRPEHVHEYALSPYSLYAAVSVGLDTDSILSVLERLSKTELPEAIPRLVRKCTSTYGKAKLVLHRNHYYVQSAYPEVLRYLLCDRVIAEARVTAAPATEGAEAAAVPEFTALALPIGDAQSTLQLPRPESPGRTASTADDGCVSREDAILELERRLEGDGGGGDDDADAAQAAALEDEAVRAARELGLDDDLFASAARPTEVLSFEVHAADVEHVKRRCLELQYPLLEEYDFRNDTQNPNTALDLKPHTRVRPYQEKSLAKMFGNGRARCGVIVLPCGAGKTLVGVTAACTMKKTCLVLCTSAVSVEQWRHQFLLWSTVDERAIARFTAEQRPTELTDVMITTYTMVAFGGRRSEESERMIRQIRQREWGLIILDEVHVVPANMFRKVLGIVKAHAKLGLTATLVREDMLVSDINFLIGPKLYEANWLDLQQQGHLATVQCAEVWCPMTAEFYREYLQRGPGKRKLLYAMNPNKFRTCEFLMRFHEARGDKVIIFSDNIFALRHYATLLRRPFIYGPTSQTERMRVLTQFQRNPVCNTIMLSKVGDTSIDLPEANVIIQISGQYGSRRQEAQRLGRILRPKPRPDQSYNAFYYSLVSTDTAEMYFASKRQQFLIDQGYAFKVIAHIAEMAQYPSTGMPDRDQEMATLAAVLAAEDAEGADTSLAEELERRRLAKLSQAPVARARRIVHEGAQAVSGADGLLYGEFARGHAGAPPASSSSLLERRVVRHPLFRKRRQQMHAKAAASGR